MRMLMSDAWERHGKEHVMTNERRTAKGISFQQGVNCIRIWDFKALKEKESSPSNQRRSHVAGS
jgi:hypothetical protein